ncbi:MAG: TetR/AcrR family transcriptional regulator [bacterium]|nr:TetR/AcrR family transcriptional regulator [bacterium]
MKRVNTEENESRERVLDAAERLFVASGYAAIKLKHIAQALGMKESSLYYHFRGGKEEMYVAVMHRSYARHGVGIQQAIAQAGDDWIAQLKAVARWFLSQPAIDVMRINKADLPAINPADAAALDEAAYTALNLPIRHILERAVESDAAVVPDLDLIAGIFISMISTIDVISSEWNRKTKSQMADDLIDSWVNGLRRR